MRSQRVTRTMAQLARPRYNWKEFWAQREQRHQPAPTPKAQGTPTAPGLAGLARKVASTPEGNRNAVLHWAACRVAEGGYPDSAYEVLAEAARTAGLPNSEIYKTSRSASRQRVVA